MDQANQTMLAASAQQQRSLAANLHEPAWPCALPPGVRALYTTRGEGFSLPPYAAMDGDGHVAGGFNLALHVGDDAQAVAQNRARLQEFLPAAPCWLNQVHGVAVHNADVDTDTPRVGPMIPEADASVSAKKQVVCCVMTADCLPVLLCDSSGQVVAAAHAGWRGLAGGVLQNTVLAMRQKLANFALSQSSQSAHSVAPISSSIFAWLGPAIGPQHFEVGAEVQQAFVDSLGQQANAAFLPGQPGKAYANIYLLAKLALAQVGVTQISGGDACTFAEADKYFSYRRSRSTGRMAAMIWRE